jgi:hypothetical protein
MLYEKMRQTWCATDVAHHVCTDNDLSDFACNKINILFTL